MDMDSSVERRRRLNERKGETRPGIRTERGRRSRKQDGYRCPSIIFLAAAQNKAARAVGNPSSVTTDVSWFRRVFRRAAAGGGRRAAVNETVFLREGEPTSTRIRARIAWNPGTFQRPHRARIIKAQPKAVANSGRAKPAVPGSRFARACEHGPARPPVVFGRRVRARSAPVRGLPPAHPCPFPGDQAMDVVGDVHGDRPLNVF
jgi:hypothetical protein